MAHRTWKGIAVANCFVCDSSLVILKPLEAAEQGARIAKFLAETLAKPSDLVGAMS